ncbi:MAG: tyrosine protein kinase [Tannerellaceae bacterium]|jgi:uncharacterized protein involved in exopolysaccharide biosynthesis|nr:tyrosine protein kinase [Tannerellaceae bacterium]
MEQKDTEYIGLKTILINYMSHWRLFLGAFLFTLAAGILYVVFYPRTYEVMARIQLQEDKGIGAVGAGLGEAAGLLRSFGLGGGVSGTLNVDDELNLLTSNALMKKVALDLGINVEYTRPRSFYRLYDNTPIKLTAADSLTREKLSEEVKFIVRLNDGSIHIKTKSRSRDENSFTFASLPAVLPLPEGNFILDYGVKHLPIEDMDILYKPAGWKAEEMEKEFTIEVYSKNSNIIELSCTDYERNRAVNTINKLISYYNRETTAYMKELNSKTLAYLDARIDSLTLDLQVIEIEIADFKNINSLTDVEHDVQFYVAQLAEIQTKIVELETQAHLIRLMSDFVKDPANQYSPMPGLMSQEGDKSSPIQLYNQMLIERARIIQNSNENNPLVPSLTLQSDRLRESVYLSIENLEKATRQSISDMKAKEKILFNTMKSYPGKERSYIELKRRQEIAQGIYLILLQKREETALESGLASERGKIIDAAFVKKKPVAPRKIYAALGIILFTILIPVVWLFIQTQVSSLLGEYRRRKQ